MAAGGGSMLFFRSGMFVVGPESAGADPGPVCYMKGRPGIVKYISGSLTFKVKSIVITLNRGLIYNY